MEKVKLLFKKHKEIIMYIIFGGVTTLVNLICFTLFTAILGESLYLIANTISWIVSVLFAYITNKLWVFESRGTNVRLIVKEMISFFIARLLSFAVESAGLYLLISLIGLNEHMKFNIFGFNLNGQMISKIIFQVVVVILNYIFSKLFVFKKTNQEQNFSPLDV